MPNRELTPEPLEVERYELRSDGLYRFDPDRRDFVQVLGAGLMIAATVRNGAAQQPGGRGRRGRGDGPRSERLTQPFHIDGEGNVTVFTSKVEIGQGARTQLTQAAAEELRLPIEQIRLVMADTSRCPDDGGTAGSRTTPATVPQIRRSAAAARQALAALAAERLGVEATAVTFRDGEFIAASADKKISLVDLARDAEFHSRLDAQPRPTGDEVSVTPVKEWRVLGRSVAKVGGREVVTGGAHYPSDITRPKMLYGKVLRAPAVNATLKSLDLASAEQLGDVTVVRDGGFVGVAARTTWDAAKALDALAKSATWDSSPHVSSDELFDHLKKTATSEGDGWPRPRTNSWGDGAQPIAAAREGRKLEVAYRIAYIQHAPMEPRAAVAEWDDGQLTVWTGSQQPSRVQGELASAFRLPPERVRVIVPDTGGGFGGKHTGEAAVEAARLAKAAGRPVSLRWTREEEFTWAYCRPAGLIEVGAALDGDGRLLAWDFTNYNSGESGINSPYQAPHGRTQFLAADSPLRQGSYRALASTANNFARESAMDELAGLAAADPLEFRLSHLPDGRLKDVLITAATAFNWKARRADLPKDHGVGLACGTEKGSFVAACVEVEAVDGVLKIHSICQAFECGAIHNPGNVRRQVEGAIIMGLGGALTEQMRFKDGKLSTVNFSKYQVPRMGDVPPLEIVLMDRPDLPSVGAGETPIIAVAPALANAIAHACGKRVREMPLLADGRRIT